MLITLPQWLVGFTGMMAIVGGILAIPVPKDPIHVPAWSDSFRDAILRQAPMQATTPKSDREPLFETASIESPKPVDAGRIVTPDAPVSMPPVVVVQEPSAPRRRRHARAVVGDDTPRICAKHGMRKKITRGGKSWRCIK